MRRQKAPQRNSAEWQEIKIEVEVDGGASEPNRQNPFATRTPEQRREAFIDLVRNMGFVSRPRFLEAKGGGK
jgi:hypothetical protein